MGFVINSIEKMLHRSQTMALRWQMTEYMLNFIIECVKNVLMESLRECQLCSTFPCFQFSFPIVTNCTPPPPFYNTLPALHTWSASFLHTESYRECQLCTYKHSIFIFFCYKLHHPAFIKHCTDCQLCTHGVV
jgi:hypothetical protein